MSTTIWKYPIEIADQQYLELPTSAEILSVQTQFDSVYVWVKLNPTVTRTARQLRLFGTGQLVPDSGLRFVGTFQIQGGHLVFHLFEEVSA